MFTNKYTENINYILKIRTRTFS